MKQLKVSGDEDKVHLEGGALCHGRPPLPVKTLFVTFAINCLALLERQRTQPQAGGSSNEAERQKRSPERKIKTKTQQHFIFSIL